MENVRKRLRLLIPFKWVAITAYAILIVPILIFFFGWLRWYLAILFSAILLLGAYWVIKKDYWQNNDKIEMPISILIGAFIAFCLWILISGCCYTSAGWCDIVWRTTTFRDLVFYDWPVFYPEKNGYLCYYFVFWMVPALIGKLFGGMPAAWAALGGWFILILLTTFLLISYLFKDYKKSTLKTIIVFMIMWSGINILGMFLVNNLGLPSLRMYFGDNESYCDYFWSDGYPFNFYYRSNCDFISNPYNQIPIWLVVPLMLQNRKIHNYAFLGLLVFPFSPWGTAGFALIMVADAIYYFIKEKSFMRFLKEIFSIPNLCAIFFIFLVFLPFFSQTGGISKPEEKLRLLPFTKMTPQIWQGTIIFWLCEFGLYYLFIWKEHRKDHLFWSMLPMLMFIPFFQIGSKEARDVCMNVSLPLLYILMIYMIGYVKAEITDNSISFQQRFKLKNSLLIIALGLSFTTSIFSWMRAVSTMNTNQSISVQDHSASTFADLLGYSGGWVAPVSSNVEDKVFFKFLAKPVDKENAQWLPISENLSNIRNIDDIDEYLDYLVGKDCTVFIAVKDVQGYCLKPQTIEKLKQLGFDSDVDKLLEKNYHSFIGIVKNSGILHEQIGGDEYISYYGEGIIDGDNVWMESATWNTRNYAVINIKDGYYCVNSRGLNIVVKDNAAGRIIDAVAFDTHVDEMTCTHKAL